MSALGIAVFVATLAGRADATHLTADLTRKQATAVALRALKPRRGQIVFALAAPLASKQKVGEAFSAQSSVGRKAWLFWADGAPYAYFQHPSRLLLVDAHSGRLIRDRTLRWWPVVDGRAPVFVRSPSAYARAAYRVYPKVSRRTAVVQRSPSSPSIRLSKVDVPAGAYKADCLIAIGPYEDGWFGPGVKAIESWADGVGLPRTRVDPDADGRPNNGLPTVGDLGVTIGQMTRKPKSCNDVFVYVFGHGKQPPSGKPDVFGDGGSFNGAYSGVADDDVPAVSMVQNGTILVSGRGDYTTDITSRELRELFAAFAKEGITFKLAVESCFSGRFANDLKQQTPENVLLTLTSTSADRVSFGRVQGKKGQTVGIDWKVYTNGKVQTRFTQIELPSNRSADGPGEFMTGLLEGYKAFASSQVQIGEAADTSAGTGLPFLVLALRDSFGAAGRFDLAAKNGITKPRIVFRAPQYSVSALSHDTTQAPKFLCGFADGPPGSSATIGLTYLANGKSATSPPLTFGSDGRTGFRWTISELGPYRVSVIVGGKTVAHRDYTVPDAPGRGPFSCR